MLLSVVISFIVLGCIGTHANEAANMLEIEGKPATPSEIAEYGFLLREVGMLPRWGNRNYTDKEWDAYIRTARQMQTSRRGLVAKVLEDFCISEGRLGDNQTGASGSQALILNVLMFDLGSTEKVGIAMMSGFIGQNPTLPSWPVSLENERPKVISFYNGREGLPYNGGSQFLFFLANVRFRRL
jgi:hypothetical protein